MGCLHWRGFGLEWGDAVRVDYYAGFGQCGMAGTCSFRPAGELAYCYIDVSFRVVEMGQG